MSRALLILSLGLGLVLAGCGTLRDDARSPRRGRDGRQVNQRVERQVHQRVGRDVNEYVRWLDGRVRLNSRQANRIDNLLTDRTHRLLNRARPSEYRRVYPFPRERRGAMTRAERQWWDDTDRAIDQVLSGGQRNEYRYITGRRQRNDRDRRYTYENRDDRDRRDRDRDDRNRRNDDDDDRRRGRDRDDD